MEQAEQLQQTQRGDRGSFGYDAEIFEAHVERFGPDAGSFGAGAGSFGAGAGRLGAVVRRSRAGAGRFGAEVERFGAELEGEVKLRDLEVRPPDQKVEPPDQEVGCSDLEVRGSDPKVARRDLEVSGLEQEASPLDQKVSPLEQKVSPLEQKVAGRDLQVERWGRKVGRHPALAARLLGGVPLLLTVVLLLPLFGCAGLAQGDPLGPSTPPAAAPVPPSQTDSQRPNFIVVLSDDHRWDALGVAGNSAIVTPVMDRLAREGVYFRQATTSVSQCHPVRASLLTGLPSYRHGVYSYQFQEPGVAETFCKRATVASLLRDAGYHTALVGKWHIPSLPWDCGFAETRTWLPGGAADYQNPELVHGHSSEHEKVAGFTQEIFADQAIDFLRGETARTRPFLLWLGFTAPHFAAAPNPERIEALYAGKKDEELFPPGFPRDVEANDWRHYNEAVSHLDEQLGRVLATLQETGLAERTVVVLLGDNGYMMGERGIGGPGTRAKGKQVPYESSLRVPFLLRGPGLPKALASDLPASSLDLPPTLLSLAGVPVPDSWPGRDLKAALAGKLDVREAFAEWSDEKSDAFGKLAYRAVRTPTHKLIVWKDPARTSELYDLAADPAEAHNLITNPAAQEVLRDLHARLDTWMRRNEDPAVSWSVGR